MAAFCLNGYENVFVDMQLVGTSLKNILLTNKHYNTLQISGGNTWILYTQYCVVCRTPRGVTLG